MLAIQHVQMGKNYKSTPERNPWIHLPEGKRKRSPPPLSILSDIQSHLVHSHTHAECTCMLQGSNSMRKLREKWYHYALEIPTIQLEINHFPGLWKNTTSSSCYLTILGGHTISPDCGRPKNRRQNTPEKVNYFPQLRGKINTQFQNKI